MMKIKIIKKMRNNNHNSNIKNKYKFKKMYL